MGSSGRKKEKRKGGGEKHSTGGAKSSVVTDPRFASVHSDPRFQKMPKRETKVSIDPRFDKMFTDRNFGSSAAPVDKRGRRKQKKENPLQRYYQMEETEEDESEEDKEEKGLKVGGAASEESESEGDAGVDVESDDTDEMKGLESVMAEFDTDEEEEMMMMGGEESDESDEDEKVPETEEETSRLAVVNVDWHHIKAVDLYTLLNSFLPSGGRILSVTVYPSEFGLQRMKEEAVHGPVGLFDDDDDKKNKKKNNGSENEDESEDGSDDEQNESQDEEDDEELENVSEDDMEGEEDDLENNSDDDMDEEDKEYVDSRIRDYEKTRLRYYFAVVCCDSIATANHLYRECDGTEIMHSSNKLDLRYIPDSMEFKNEARDAATEVPSGYKPSDFFTKALQLTKPVLTWDEDEPERAKTLKRKFNADELDKLEMKEFLASDESDSDDEEDDDNDGFENKSTKKHKKVDAYQSLLLGGGVDEDGDNDDDEGQDMEVTFNTGLEDISKRILEKKENKSETVWEAHLRKQLEKKKARKSKKESEDENDDTDHDAEGADDFFVDMPAKKSKKGKSGKKNADKTEDEAKGASTAELELLLADDRGTEAHVKGYKINPKTFKKGKAVVNEDKLPEADLDDPRFQSLFQNPLFALDPTDPQFKRSAAYRRQLAEKQKKADQDPLSAKECVKLPQPTQSPSSGTDTKPSKTSDPKPSSNGNNYEISSLVKSIKMKSKEAVKKAKPDLSSVARSLKKKTRRLVK